MRVSRALLLVAGFSLAGWGAWKLVAFELVDLRAVALWLAGESSPTMR